MLRSTVVHSLVSALRMAWVTAAFDMSTPNSRWRRVASTRGAEREITTSRSGVPADAASEALLMLDALAATKLSRTSGLVARTPSPTVDSGGDDGDRGGQDMGLGQTAGIGFPLVAMVCHSADPLLGCFRGNVPIACGERDVSND